MNTPRARLLLAAHILRALTLAQREGKATGLDELCESLGVERARVRATLSQLHLEGFLDVTTMRLTLQGFGFGGMLVGRRLGALTLDERDHVRAA